MSETTDPTSAWLGDDLLSILGILLLSGYPTVINHILLYILNSLESL